MSARKKFRAILFTEKKTKEDLDKFNLVLQPRVCEPIWEQIYEIAEMGKFTEDVTDFEIVIDGLLGVKSTDKICALADKAKIVWVLPAMCVEDALKKLEGKKTKFSVEVRKEL